jgi:hypothetical protein
VRGSLTALRGHRDELRLEPSRPAQALDALLAEMAAAHDLGQKRLALLRRSGGGTPAGTG